jgi:ferredoxin-thioredoxin reductase catalytic chain
MYKYSLITMTKQSLLLVTILIALLADDFAHALVASVPSQQPPANKRMTNTKLSASQSDPVALEKATKAMTAFTNKYLKNTGTKLCSDKSVPAVVIKGLAEHKVTLGAPLCPCRFYDDKEAEVKDGYWNCPCVPMRERHGT